MTEYNFSQQDSRQQCVDVILFTDTLNEPPELFTLELSTSSLLANVIIDPSSAIVSIADNVNSVLTDTLNKTGTVNQTDENLEIIGGVIQDITSSALSSEIPVDTQVSVFCPIYH